MRYTLEVYQIMELGKRKNQEDCMFPNFGEANTSNRVFIVCDGMGGHAKGEVASETICKSLGEATSSNTSEIFTENAFHTALQSAYETLDLKDDGEDEKKMGTTLTFLKLHSEGATIAHIGDSRVYHIRPGIDATRTQIIFQTTDHSLLNDLIKSGDFTPEEAAAVAPKNVITRAIQPNMAQRAAADIHHTSDIQAEDCFMLCSDGILEQLSNENIQHLFSSQTGDFAAKTELLKQLTAENRDNHTAIIVHITSVEE